jgi:hypothetical protein
LLNLFKKREDPIKGFVSVRVYRHKKGFWETIADKKPNLLTNGGRDFFHAQCYTNTSAGTKGSMELAVSTNTGGASAAHTSLAGEITTGGLGRLPATTITHSAGTNTTTLVKTWTASATHTDVQLAALFNTATTGGTMTHEATFTATTLVSGDQLELTWTLTLG